MIATGLSWISGILKGPKIEPPYGKELEKLIANGWRTGSIVALKTVAERNDISDSQYWHVISEVVENAPRFNLTHSDHEFFKLQKLGANGYSGGIAYTAKELILIHSGPTKKSIAKFTSRGNKK